MAIGVGFWGSPNAGQERCATVPSGHSFPFPSRSRPDQPVVSFNLAVRGEKTEIIPDPLTPAHQNPELRICCTRRRASCFQRRRPQIQWMHGAWCQLDDGATIVRSNPRNSPGLQREEKLSIMIMHKGFIARSGTEIGFGRGAWRVRCDPLMLPRSVGYPRNGWQRPVSEALGIFVVNLNLHSHN